MKVFILLACLIAVVYCEYCHKDSDCQHTGCNDQSHKVMCLHGHCTCAEEHSGHSCTSVQACSDQHCKFGQKVHCVDGKCHCTYGSISG